MGWLHIRMARRWSGRVWLGIRLLSVLALLQLECKSGAQVLDGVQFFQIMCTIMHSNMRVLKLRLPIGFELLANYMSYSIRELAILFLCNVSGIYFWRSALDSIFSVSGYLLSLSTQMKFFCTSHPYLFGFIFSMSRYGPVHTMQCLSFVHVGLMRLSYITITSVMPL